MRSLVTNLDFSDFTVYGGGLWGQRLARAWVYTRTPVVPGLSMDYAPGKAPGSRCGANQGLGYL